MPVHIDQISRKFELDAPPGRIVSLVPSQTELLVDLGLADHIVGVTKFCVHPEKLRIEKTVIGGTKNVHLDRVKNLNPDLIIANKEENRREDIEALARSYPVYVSDIENLKDAKEFALDIGALTGNEKRAHQLISLIDEAISSIRKLSKNTKPIRVLYMIWKDPYMAAGTDTFINEILHLCGAHNVLHEYHESGLRYPTVSFDDFKTLRPDVILLSSEPYPFRKIHARELIEKTEIETRLVNGEIF